MRKLALLLVLGWLTPAEAAIPAWTSHTTMWQWWDAQQTLIPGANGNQYKDLTRSEQVVLGIGILQLLVKDYEGGRVTLNRVGMEVYTLLDTSYTPNKTWYIVKELAASSSPSFKGKGMYVINPNPERNVVVVNTHPVFDSGSHRSARRLFERMRGVLLMASSVHRCNSTTPTPCDGTFDGCSTTGYKISDAAHNTNHPIFAVHEWAVRNIEPRYVIEVHSKGATASDIEVSAGACSSTGTTGNMGTTEGLANLTRNALKNSPNVTIASCNHPDDDAITVTFTAGPNPHGRLLNGVGPREACNTAASAPSGRWMHIEATSDVWTNHYVEVHTAIVAQIPKDR